MAAHAKLSPSASSRWLFCPPSALLEAAEPKTSTRYADEGILAHAVCEAEVLYRIARIGCKEYDARIADCKRNELFAPEMIECADGYADYVVDRYERLRKVDLGTIILTEKKLDLGMFIPNGFGTADILIVGAGCLVVIDYKHGKGVKVSAVGNTQLRTYALGAMEWASIMYEVENVYMMIYQPRIDNISETAIKADALLRWGNDVLIPGAKRAAAGEGEMNPGEHCQFCKIKPKCAKYADYQLELAKLEFLRLNLLTPEQISEIVLRAKSLSAWLTSVKDYAMQRALSGETLPGIKLVEGRATRKYIDKDAVYSALIKAGLRPKDITETEVLGLTKMQQVLGKKKFDELLNAHIVKSAGAPTLVGTDDPRPVFSPAEKDFEHLIERDDDPD